MELINYEVKKSRFYSICLPINSKDEIKNYLKELRAGHKKSTHICYGYLFIDNGVINAGFDDDGEPNGTAGRPIRDLLIKTKMENFVIFVIRYFGGVKLGAGGLVRAYIKSANLALQKYREGV
ncbi:YigZ family protein [Mycoplasma sp. ES3157-GEN-MYC]|uniref:YigZ family protein n=1 Tax=Mycoplasma miroungigenitalium TaxID=754515 RepID=A0A6M4J9J3_9MOLU|nr:YigZ family protein [Mycoplasma miroungigenitalium]MBU4690516.1 YigZ family protein [Mycoplasma miroungigenitalium]MBU4691783.1 YigZ family protein [Mycoplasma miroungigenitalium]QJR43610.1 YigZ family protein [Mycoplasma miroungigenitalium]